VKKTLRYLAVLAFLTAISVPASLADGGGSTHTCPGGICKPGPYSTLR
jgi:hypothetical protein